MQRGGSPDMKALLFSNGEEGTWYDPSDTATLFQDTAGLTPVTSDGDPVRRMEDKSGNGNHAIAPSDAARPTYKTSGGLGWLEFNGVDNSMAAPAIDFTVSDKITVFVGVHKASDAASGTLVELSDGTAQGRFAIFAPSGAAANYFWRSRGNATVDITVTTYAAPITNVFTGIADISGDSSIVRIDGSEITENTGDQGTGTFGNQPLNIGMRNAAQYPLNGRIYGLITRSGLSSADEISAAESYISNKSGVSL